jgi:hypothetical protein
MNGTGDRLTYRRMHSWGGRRSLMTSGDSRPAFGVYYIEPKVFVANGSQIYFRQVRNRHLSGPRRAVSSRNGRHLIR